MADDSPASPALRALRATLAVALTCGSLAWSADLFRTLGLAVLDEQIMAGMLACGLALVYIVFPARRGAPRTRVPWYDWLAAIAGFAAAWYVGFTFPTLVERMIESPPDALIVGTILYLLCMEGLRRTTGYALFVIVLLFSVYSLVGHLVPGDLQTRRIDLSRLLIYVSLDTNALFGFVLKVAASIVVTFIFFGQLLLRSGGAQFFNDLALVLMGRFRGGSAKISVLASSMFGTISGIVVSNIVATGVVTIPLMKRQGFPPRLAAAVEACASTGGQLMPPVMGATAFVMADFLSRPYRDIVVAALVPSVLYYVALFIQADLEAARRGITRIEESLIPRPWPVLRSGWIFLAPFAVLVYTMFWLNWLVEASAIAASLTVLVLGSVLGYQGKRLTPRDVYRALHDTGTGILDLLMIAAGASFIIGILMVTGLSFAFTLVLLKVGGGSLFVLLLVAAALCIILGMGMPTLAVYIILAALIAPSLVELGITPLAAHMFVMYLGMMSFLTPPVAIAAYFAASMAGAPPMATGWTSVRFGWTAYVVPFLFVFSPTLLLEDRNVLRVVVDVATAVGGVWLLSISMVGYMLQPLALPLRGSIFVAGVLLLVPYKIAPAGYWTSVAGAGLALLLIAWEYYARHQREAAAQPAR